MVAEQLLAKVRKVGVVANHHCRCHLVGQQPDVVERFAVVGQVQLWGYPQVLEGEPGCTNHHRGCLQGASGAAYCGKVYLQPAYGQRLAAFVVLTDDASTTTDELKAHVRENLANYKVPRSITVLEGLPRGSTGKILRRELQELEDES